MSESQSKNKVKERKVTPPKLQQTSPFRMMQIHHNVLIWTENIKLQKQNVRGVGWIQMIQQTVSWSALVNSVMNLRVLRKPGEFLQ